MGLIKAPCVVLTIYVRGAPFVFERLATCWEAKKRICHDRGQDLMKLE
jgi:hypothetical protein